MAKRNMTLREFCERYRRGDFKSKDRDVQVEAGWYRYCYCDDAAVLRRLKKIWKVLKGITDDFVLDSYYVRFHNCKSFKGSLYDTIEFFPIDEKRLEKLYFDVTIGCKIDSKNKYTVSFFAKKDNPTIWLNKAKDVATSINKWGQEACRFAECNPVNKGNG